MGIIELGTKTGSLDGLELGAFNGTDLGLLEGLTDGTTYGKNWVLLMGLQMDSLRFRC